MSNEPYSQNAVSATVWPWTKEPEPETKKSLARVLLQAAIPFSVAAIMYFVLKGHWRIPAVIVACIGTIMLFLGLFVPAAFHKVEGFVWRIVGWVGVGLTWLLLVPLYYTYFLIGGFFMKAKGKDPMERTLKPDAESYWIQRKPFEDPKVHFRRQY